jgi:hypothetical protein
MESTGVLLAIAEVGIGLAGFGGIAAGLGYRVRDHWTVEDRNRLIGSTTTSLTVVFACLVPYMVHHFVPAKVVTFSGALLLPLVLVDFVRIVQVFRRGLGGYNPAAAFALVIANLCCLTTLLILLSGIAADLGFGLYLLAVLLLLFQAALLFVRLLVNSFRESDLEQSD